MLRPYSESPIQLSEFWSSRPLGETLGQLPEITGGIQNGAHMSADGAAGHG